MSETIKTGWLNDQEGNKFAPKTLASQVQTSDGTLLEDEIQADLDVLQKEIDSKASLVHTHTVGDVTDLQINFDEITEQLTTKVNVSDIAHNLATNDSSKVLSAAQGVAIDSAIKSLESEINRHKHIILATASDDDVVILTGDSGDNSVFYSVSHADSGIDAGMYNSVMVDAKGHVTHGFNHTTLAGYMIEDAYTKTEVDAAISSAVNSKNTWYGTCPTAASTTAKVVTTSTGNFSLTAGNIVYVLFTYASASNSTLNVDGTGEIAIKSTGTTNVLAYQWAPNEAIGFVYDGTYFRMLDGMVANTTYYGMTKLSSSTSSTSTTTAATPSAVKSAYDLANAALPKTGGTMTGTLTLNADPSNAMDAATKQYVDNLIGSILNGAS